MRSAIVRLHLPPVWIRKRVGLRQAAALAAMAALALLLAPGSVSQPADAGDAPIVAAPAPAPTPSVDSGLAQVAEAILEIPDRPLDVSVDGKGHLYVLEGGAQRWVRIFDASGRQLSAFEVTGLPGAPGPAYLAVGPDGLIYVGDRGTRSVLAFDEDGALVRSLGSPLAGDWLPLGVAFDGAGNLFVTDVTPGQHRVLRVDGDGELLWVVGRQGSGPGQFDFPTDVAVDARGRVYVSDSSNRRVQVLDGSGSFVQLLPAEDRHLEPRGLAIDGDVLYVVSTSEHQVLVYDVSNAPRLLTLLPGEGGPAPALSYPNGAAAGAGGRVYVADRGGNRIVAWEP